MEVHWPREDEPAGPGGTAILAGPPRRATETLHARCDLTAAADKRSGEHNDAFADRRPAYCAERLRQS
jgi:hypothetical protein